MRRLGKFTVVMLGTLLMGCTMFAGCGDPADGASDTTGATVEVDEGITIDGVFDESFYTGRNWLSLNKIMQQSDRTETGTLEMTTYFSETGLVVAAHIVDSRAAVYSSSAATSDQTCFSGYFRLRRYDYDGG